MSTFIYVLVCIGIVAIKFYFEQKEKSANPTTPSEVLTEVFPVLPKLKDEVFDNIEEDDNLSDDETIAPQKHLTPLFVDLPKSSSKASSKDVKAIETKKIGEKPETNHSSEATIKDIKLSTRTEARQAFIYSEIFKRKYE